MNLARAPIGSIPDPVATGNTLSPGQKRLDRSSTVAWLAAALASPSERSRPAKLNGREAAISSPSQTSIGARLRLRFTAQWSATWIG
jgi:hypothetical protein